MLPHHCINQSFALPPATTPVSHLTYPLPLHQSVIWHALYHCITALLHHCITALLCYCITMLLCHHITTSLHYHITTLPHHCVTTLLHHHITVSPHEIFPTTLVWIIWLAPTTALPCHCVRFSSPHWYESFNLPLPPCYHITAWDSPHHIGMNHLTCPYNDITASLHEIFPTTLVWIIWLAPTTILPCYCVTTSPYYHITTPLHYHVTVSPCHHVTASLHEIFPTTLVWIWLVNAPHHSQSDH